MSEGTYPAAWEVDKAEAESARRVLAALEAEAEACDGRLVVVWETLAANIRRDVFA
jgi:hypothetical protein